MRTTKFRDNNARLFRIIFPNGTRGIFRNDFAGRLTQLRDEMVATHERIHRVQLNYDPLDRIIQELVSPVPASLSVSPAFMHDDADDRLTIWNSQPAKGDADGNLFTAPIMGTISTLTWNVRNQPTSARGVS